MHNTHLPSTFFSALSTSIQHSRNALGGKKAYKDKTASQTLGRTGYAFIKHSTRKRWVNSFTLRLLYPGKKATDIQQIGNWRIPKTVLRWWVREFQSVSGIQIRPTSTQTLATQDRPHQCKPWYILFQPVRKRARSQTMSTVGVVTSSAGIYTHIRLCVYMVLYYTHTHTHKIYYSRGHPSQPPPKSKFKKHRFCRYDSIKRLTWFTLRPKSATEIDWWLVH
jgi:hypothetical protein